MEMVTLFQMAMKIGRLTTALMPSQQNRPNGKTVTEMAGAIINQMERSSSMISLSIQANGVILMGTVGAITKPMEPRKLTLSHSSQHNIGILTVTVTETTLLALRGTFAYILLPKRLTRNGFPALTDSDAEMSTVTGIPTPPMSG